MGMLYINFSLAGFERKKIKSYAIYSICAFYIIKNIKVTTTEKSLSFTFIGENKIFSTFNLTLKQVEFITNFIFFPSTSGLRAGTPCSQGFLALLGDSGSPPLPC